MKIVSAILLIMVSESTIAQGVSVLELKPIQKQGWKYFYDFKAVENPSALQIPLTALNDPEINQYFVSYKNLNKIGNIVWVAPVIVLLNRDMPSNRFPIFVAGTMAASIVFNILAHQKMKKAITRYNLLIIKNEQN